MSAVIESVADLLQRLGNVPAWRVLMVPTPGTATEADLIRVLRGPDSRVCELIDGTLVEKPVGFHENLLAAALIMFLKQFVAARKLGIVTGEQGMMWVTPSRLRGPDVAFVSWDRFPGRRIPRVSYPHVAPDLAIEVLSPSNTRKEMKLKRQDYFGAGTLLVWEVDPKKRTVSVYESADEPEAVLTSKDTLTGGSVLPGFKLRLAELFAELDMHG